jgi:hypothetical protein
MARGIVAADLAAIGAAHERRAGARMSGFTAQWLALREAADAAARSERLVSFLLGNLARDAERVALRTGLDLGGGTGSNIRYLSSRLPTPQRWVIVDDDPALLAQAPAGVTTRILDLNAAVRDGGLFSGCSLVTSSALLDLVSESWLAELIAQCRAAESAVLFALSYDGRIVCSPSEPEDEEIRRLVNAHQKTDKGFGPALGPDAAARTIALLTSAGYDTKQDNSDWKLGPEMKDLQRELIAAWAAAGMEIAPAQAKAIDEWRSRRLAHVDSGRSRLVVGHADVAGVITSHR